jgi:uncharacterized damage-inducible protein DinB
MLDSLINELRQEAVTTKRVLERIPEEKLSWKPHQTSLSLGQLSLHVASIPGNVTSLAQLDAFDASDANFVPPEPESVEQILRAFDESMNSAESYLSGLDNKAATDPWRLTSKGEEVFSMPRISMLRTIMLNHWYHHRGQLLVYLRLLDQSVPSVYGPTADENPFAA